MTPPAKKAARAVPRQSARKRAGGAPPKRVHLTPTQRAERGKAARKQAPRRGLAAWEPAPDRGDPVAVFEQQALTRVPELIPIRHGRMLASPFSFYRGAAAIMAADLAPARRRA